MDLSSLTGMFVGLHLLVAQKTNTPELAIGLDEGHQFMTAAQNVMRHYSVQTTQKTLDWIAFAGVAGGMYLTRGVAIANRRGAEKAAKKAAEGALHFRPARGVKVVPGDGHALAGDQLGDEAAQVVGADLSGLTIEPGHLGLEAAE